ncbi:MAG: tandem-95 repeat protein, partial [Algibacter sp.]|uniref:tandem-95 repeat protein n=1 Tax=Algibacter sp. TaxID=1872428 RepID=UPI003296CE9F
DTDGDGLTDCEENTGIDDPSTPLDPAGTTTDPNDACDPIASSPLTDTDGDGLTDCEETTGLDNPNTPLDPSGVTSDPNDACSPVGINTVDTDGDGLTDCEENTGIDDSSTPLDPAGTTTDPNDACDPIASSPLTDSDGDGLTDCEETTGLDNPNTPLDPSGVTSDPNDACSPVGINTVDTDGDGLTDCEENTGIDDPSTPLDPAGTTTDPNDACDPIASSPLTDSDGDGLTDCEETTGLDNPNTPLDPSGVTSDPNDACSPVGINTVDTDGDGLTDCEENTGIDDPSTPLDPAGTTTDPNDACDPIASSPLTDSDGDGLTDCEETTGLDNSNTPLDPSGVTSDPNDSCDPIGSSSLIDSDGDGLTDCEETTGLDNPNTPLDPAGTISDPNDPCDPFTNSGGCTPIANDDLVSTEPDVDVIVDVTSNDTDPNGTIDVATLDLDPATPGQQTTFTVPGEGTYKVNPDGTVTFDPESTFTGTTTPIDYTVEDNDGNISTVGTITVIVATCPNGTDSDGDGLTDCEETTGIDDPSTPLDPLGLLSDPNNACDPIASSPLIDSDGDGLTDCEETTGLDNPNTPLDPAGTISNPNDACSPFTDAGGCTPIAEDDSAITNVDTDVIIDLTGNDVDPNGTIDDTTIDLDPLTPGRQSTFTVPGEGTYTDNGDGTITFSPEPSFTGTSTITYTVNDEEGNTTNEATITVVVQDNPIAQDDVDEDNAPGTAVTLNVIADNGNGEDSDSDGIIDASTVTITTPGAIDTDSDGDNDTLVVSGEGTWTLDEAGNLMFTPESGFTGNPTEITYTVKDNEGNESNEATVTITYLMDTDIAPIAQNDEDLANTPGTIVIINVTEDNGNGADSDEDGSVSVTTVTISTPGATDTTGDGDNDTLVVANEGTWTLDEGGNLTFIPEPGFTGNPTPISYTIEDNDGNVSNEATVTITYSLCPNATDSDGDGLTDCEETTGIDDPSTPLNPEGKTSDPNDMCDPITTGCLALVEVTKTAEVLDTSLGGKIVYTIVVQNTGDILLTDITLVDTFLNYRGETISLTEEPTFDSADQGSEEGTLLAGESATYTASFIIDQDAIDSGGVQNSVFVSASTKSSGVVTDNSDDGIDSDGNSEDDPTVTELDCLTVFNEFSPNGDGNGDTLVIKCIDNYPDNKLEVYNRWGNIVYEKKGYNSNDEWDGTSNGRATVNSSEQLPVGTYYYVLDKGDGTKPLAGWLYINR